MKLAQRTSFVAFLAAVAFATLPSVGGAATHTLVEADHYCNQNKALGGDANGYHVSLAQCAELTTTTPECGDFYYWRDATGGQCKCGTTTNNCADKSSSSLFDIYRAEPPTPSPSKARTKAPTKAPTNAPTKAPSEAPTASVPASLPASMSGSGGSSGADGGAGAGGSTSKAFPKSSTGSASGDPHFKTFGGWKFDFHGACDLVLLQNPAFANGLGLSVHIRTRIETWWSYIEAVVVQIGDQLLELMGGPDGSGPRYWVNGVAGEESAQEDQNLKTLVQALETHLAGFKVIYTKIGSKQHKFRINLNHAGDAISLETYKDWIAVNVKANKDENFQGAKGLMGLYPSGTMVSRNGKETMNPLAFGKEWQVLSTEPMLFHETKGVQHPDECAMPSLDASAGRKKRRLGEAAITEEAAALACSHVVEEAKDGCIYDVLATNDMDMAGAY